VIQWNVHVGGSTHTYQLNVANGTCKAAKGAPAKPRLALTAGLPTFFRVITGQSSSRMAVFTGKLKVEGGIMFALAQENWFDKNWAG
jgi:putative sterol carrier protein